MRSPAERPRRPRTVIQWHDDGSKPRARNFLSDDAPPYRALMLAGVMAIVSIAAVASVIQYQRHGGLPDVGNIVETAQASPDTSPKQLLSADADTIKPAQAAALQPARKPVSPEPAATSAQSAASDNAKSGRIETAAAVRAADVAAPETVPGGAAAAKGLALADDPAVGEVSPVPLPADEPAAGAAAALKNFKEAPAVEMAEPAEALAYAPVETSADIPVPQAAPRKEEIVAAVARPEEPAAAEGPAADGDDAVVRSAVNMRAGPSDGAKVLLTIPRGARIEVAQNCKHWCAVTYDGRSGFVYKSFIRR